MAVRVLLGNFMLKVMMGWWARERQVKDETVMPAKESLRSGVGEVVDLEVITTTEVGMFRIVFRISSARIESFSLGNGSSAISSLLHRVEL